MRERDAAADSHWGTEVAAGIDKENAQRRLKMQLASQSTYIQAVSQSVSQRTWYPLDSDDLVDRDLHEAWEKRRERRSP